MRVVGEEGGALGGHLLHDLDHLGMRMADDHRPGAQQIVDVLVAAHVPDVAGPPLGDDDLVRDVAEAAAGQDAPCGLDQLGFGLGALLFGHVASSLHRAVCSANATARAPAAGNSDRLAAREFESELGSRRFQPMPEALRKSARHGKLIGRAVVGLPEVDADMGDGRDCRVSGLELARMKIDGEALGQRVAHARAASRAEACAHGSGRRSKQIRRTALPDAPPCPAPEPDAYRPATDRARTR